MKFVVPVKGRDGGLFWHQNNAPAAYVLRLLPMPVQQLPLSRLKNLVTKAHVRLATKD